MEPGDMEAWNHALADHFFNAEQAGRPVILSVDATTLAEISGVSNEDAVASLTRAVRNRFGQQGPDLFKPIVDHSLIWKQTGDKEQSPPSISLLSVAVLAATRMRSDANMSAANYYGRFKELLGLTHPPNAAYEDLPMLWKQLSWWLDEYHQGKRGRSTCREHPHWTNIGWALSQALFRESDKQRLTHFFQWIDLEPGDSMDSAELLSFFRVWVSRGRVSNGAQLMARDESHEEQLKAILVAAASSWDGTLRDEKGRKMGRILLTLEFPRKHLALAAQQPDGFPSEAIFTTDVGTVSLRSSFPGWYDSFPVSVTSEILTNGLDAERGELTLAYKPDDVIPFRQNEELDAWASVRRVIPMAQHWVLVNSRVLKAVQNYLQASVDEFSAEPQWSTDDEIVPGWILLKNVVFSIRPSAEPHASLERLVPQVKERPTFWGGLPLAQTHVYLQGGEPDLWVPAAPPGAAYIEVNLDGEIERLTPAGGVIELRHLGLEAGSHHVQVGPTSLSFHTIQTTGAVVPTGTGARRHVLRLTNGRYLPVSTGAVGQTLEQDDISIGGASIHAPGLDFQIAPPVLIPIGATEFVLLGARPGDWIAGKRPQFPKWIQDANLHPFGWEVPPSFEVVWVCCLRQGSWVTRRRANTPPLLSPRSNQEAVEQWGECLRKLPPPTEPQEAELWNKYSEAAGVSGE